MQGQPNRAAGAHGQNDARKAHRDRAKRAWTKRAEWNKIFIEAYQYVAPHRRSTRYAKVSPGAKAIHIFDNTAPTAWMRAAGKLQQDLFPPGEPFATLEPGPLVSKLGLDEDDARRELQAIATQCDPVFLDGDWDLAVHECLLDMFISTGFILTLAGDFAHKLVQFVNVSLDEMAVDSGPFGRLEGFFWKSKWTRRALYEAYPRGTFSQTFLDELEADGEKQIEVSYDTVYDAKSRHWRTCIYIADEDEADIWSEEDLECPWIAPRYFRLPGEDLGFGPVLLNLPGTKTLNKAIELTLKGAALAMMGVYTRIDDGVFNPDTARMEPGAMWPVARNGGPIGPSIMRLPTATDPNLANLTIQDMRMMLQAGFNDQQLPPDGASPRSAAEIIERVKRMGQDHAGAYGRLVHEMVLPVYRRVMELLWRQGVLKTRVKIDQLLVQARVVSPLGSAFKAERAKRYVDFLQVGMAVAPDAVHAVTPVDKGLRAVAHDLQVPAELVYTEEESQAVQQKMAQAAAQAAAAQQQQQPAPPNGDPAQASS
ncbi:MAG: portal protein [Methylocystis sp.]